MGRYFMILQLGSVFCNSAMPVSVTCVLERLSVCKLVNPSRCTSPASVILVPPSLRSCRLGSSTRCTSPASVTLVPTRLSSFRMVNPLS